MSTEFEGWHTDKEARKRACMFAYGAKKGAIYPGSARGWWVREYHSTVVMKMHLKGKPHPAGQPWEVAYSYTGPFRTEKEAKKYARGDEGCGQ